MWLSYQHGAQVTVLLAVLALLLRLPPARRGPLTRSALLRASVVEGMLVTGLYTTWRYAGSLHTARQGAAYDRAREIFDLQSWLHLPSELAGERFLLAHTTLATAANTYYALSHGSVLAVVMVWAFVRNRPVYRRWRWALVGVTGICLVLHFVPVAPPRLMPDLGFVDEARQLGQSVYAPFGGGAFDQLAAMPSLHVAWMFVAAGCWWQATRSRWRWLGVLLAATTFVVVAVTAHHWWLDGVAAGGILALVLVMVDLLEQVWPRPGSAAADALPADMTLVGPQIH